MQHKAGRFDGRLEAFSDLEDFCFVNMDGHLYYHLSNTSSFNLQILHTPYTFSLAVGRGSGGGGGVGIEQV